MFNLTDPGDAPEAVERIRSMAGRIPALRSIRSGLNCREGDNAKHLVLVSEHDSADGLAEYVAHPVHQELIAWLRPRISDRCVVDSENFA